MLGKPSGGSSVLSHKTQSTVAHVSDEIKTIKDKLEEEKLLHERMDDDIKNLQQEIIDQKRRFKG
jgi:gas vesicle protein